MSSKVHAKRIGAPFATLALVACGTNPPDVEESDGRGAAANISTGVDTESAERSPGGSEGGGERIGEARQAICIKPGSDTPCGPGAHSGNSFVNPLCNPPYAKVSVDCAPNPPHGRYTTCDAHCAQWFDQVDLRTSCFCVNGNGHRCGTNGETGGLALTCYKP
jgi:hypothetical protein